MKELNDLLNSEDAEYRLLEVVEVCFIKDSFVKLDQRDLSIDEVEKIIKETKEQLPDDCGANMDSALAKNPHLKGVHEQKDDARYRSRYAPLVSV